MQYMLTYVIEEMPPVDWDKQGFYFDEVKGGLYPKLLTENLLEPSENVADKQLTLENKDTENKND